MHSYTAHILGEEVQFHHNADLSGEVIIRRGDKELAVPGEALLLFIAARFVIPQKIARLESAAAFRPGEVILGGEGSGR